MARAKQTIKTTYKYKIKTNNKATKTKVTKSSKRGNKNRCPACGRFL